MAGITPYAIRIGHTIQIVATTTAGRTAAAVTEAVNRPAEVDPVAEAAQAVRPQEAGAVQAAGTPAVAAVIIHLLQ